MGRKCKRKIKAAATTLSSPIKDCAPYEDPTKKYMDAQYECSAVVLKKPLKKITDEPKNRKGKEQKCSDGISSTHISINEMLRNRFKQKQNSNMNASNKVPVGIVNGYGNQIPSVHLADKENLKIRSSERYYHKMRDFEENIVNSSSNSNNEDDLNSTAMSLEDFILHNDSDEHHLEQSLSSDSSQEDGSSIMSDDEDELFEYESDSGDSSSSETDNEFPLDGIEITGFDIVQNSANCIAISAGDGYTIASRPFSLFNFSSETEHSVTVGLKALQWIIRPIDTQTFFNYFFNKRSLVVKRSAYHYYKGLFDSNDFTAMVCNIHLEFDQNINIASYVNGKRTTHNDQGRVYLNKLQEHLSMKRSIQFINPQAYNDNLWYLCELLQEVFGCFVGTNNYITPKCSSGFAPHWDDVDAFILQTEGKKHWRVYAPNPNNKNPLESSGNLDESNLTDLSLVFDGWLEQGDLMYLPRGFIHQARTGDDSHSHHLTVSVCRKFSYINLIENVLKEYLKCLSENCPKLRATLPSLLLDSLGVADFHYVAADAANDRLSRSVDLFLSKMNSDLYSLLPSAVDIMAKDFMETSLPPLLSPFEREHSCQANSKDIFKCRKEFDPATEIRLIRKHCQRFVFESNEKAFIIHRMANSRKPFEQRKSSHIDVPVTFEPMYAALNNNYPRWTRIDQLGGDLRSAISFSKLLYDNCLLLVIDTVDTGLVTQDSSSLKVMNKRKLQKSSNKSFKTKKVHWKDDSNL